MNRVELSLVFLAILAVGNLRGIRESGRIFAVPTYFFIGMMLLLLGRRRLALRRPAPYHPIVTQDPVPVGHAACSAGSCC